MNTSTESGNGAWTVQRLMSWTTDYLTQHHVDEPRLSCEVLLAHATGWKRIELYAKFDQTISDQARATFRTLIKRAAAHEPIAYLVGEKEFYSLAFAVTPEVLIPRAETELLVEVAADRVNAKYEKQQAHLLDVGTGSGCIVIALLTQLPGVTAVATDISPDALALARTNAEKHGVADRLTLICADRLSGIEPGETFDVIMSNPPYIALDEMSGLDRNVRDFEPREALTDGADGLSWYRLLAAEGQKLLKPGGAIVVEVADQRAHAVREVFQADSPFTCLGAWRDRVVGVERVIMFGEA